MALPPAAHPDAPKVKIIPPLVYLAGIIVGLLVNMWMPTTVVPNPAAWIIGGILILCGAGLAGSALRFKGVGTTIRPDRAASSLVIAGPYKITRNSLVSRIGTLYLWDYDSGSVHTALIPLPVVLIIIQRGAIEPEEVCLERRFDPRQQKRARVDSLTQTLAAAMDGIEAEDDKSVLQFGFRPLQAIC